MREITPDPPGRFVDGDRLDRVRSRMSELDIDGFLTFSPANSYYLTGCYAGMYSRPVIGLVTEEQSFFIGPRLELRKADRTAWTDRVVVYEDSDDPFDVAARVVKECTLRRIGIDEGFARPSWVAELSKRIEPSFEDVTDSFLSLRAIKTEWEIEMVKRARDLSRAGIEAFLDAVESGAAEIEILEEIQQAYYQVYLDEYAQYDIGTANELGQYGFANALTGGHALEPHSLASARRIEDDHSIVGIALPSIQGYVCEQERTVLMGNIASEITEAMQNLVEARNEAMDMVAPGVGTDEIDAATTDRLREAGYEDNLIHRTGHGEGITIHEGPALNARTPGELQPGMVISIEPGLYFEDHDLALRHSDTLVVTDTGADRLTHADDGVLTID